VKKKISAVFFVLPITQIIWFFVWGFYLLSLSLNGFSSNPLFGYFCVNTQSLSCGVIESFALILPSLAIFLMSLFSSKKKDYNVVIFSAVVMLLQLSFVFFLKLHK